MVARMSIFAVRLGFAFVVAVLCLGCRTRSALRDRALCAARRRHPAAAVRLA